MRIFVVELHPYWRGLEGLLSWTLGQRASLFALFRIGPRQNLASHERERRTQCKSIAP